MVPSVADLEQLTKELMPHWRNAGSKIGKYRHIVVLVDDDRDGLTITASQFDARHLEPGLHSRVYVAAEDMTAPVAWTERTVGHFARALELACGMIDDYMFRFDPKTKRLGWHRKQK